ncbi:MAG: DUF4838 domain-containing protein, partial [Kiritimatiellae bacterium]|nr:DUF4838 domain-containing protein [Kiritimatiellia bacterium]
PACAYDIHSRALTPVSESARPAGSPVQLVRDGEIDFAIVFDRCDAKCREMEVLTNAVFRCTGRMPRVYPSSQSNAFAKARSLLLVGDQPMVRALGLRHEEMAEQGFTVSTFPRGVAIVGMDSDRISGWNKTRLDRRGASCGTLYGVLDFTERFMGCRYFFPGEYGSHFPKIRDLAVRPVRYSDKPYIRWRGEPYFFYEAFGDQKKVEHYEKYMGAVKLRDTSFAAYFREGGTTSASGMHSPRPERMVASHPDKLDLMFYRTPLGRLVYDPKDVEKDFYDVFNLKFADLLVEDWKAYFASTGKVDRGGFAPWVNNEYITFGQCDHMLPLKDYVNHPVVRKLGLVNGADIARGAPMADANARFFQHLARRVGEEFPGKKLNILAYYTSRHASRNPKWRLPPNVSVMMCPGSFPKRARSPRHVAELLESMKDWREACSGNPVSHLWFYTEGTPVVAAISGEFTGETLRLVEPYFGREAVLLNTAGWKLWHYYWTFYASFRCQWNPQWDVDAGIDEHWPLFYGPAAGAHMREFHRLLKKASLDHFAVESRRIYPKAVVDALERELLAAGALLAEGSPERRRWQLVYDFWPDVFKKHREAATFEPPFVDAPRYRDEPGFWDGVAEAKGFSFPVPVRFAWSERGLHVRSAAWHSPTDIPSFEVAPGLSGTKKRTYRFASVDGLIPFAEVGVNGQPPKPYDQWSVSGGVVRFDGDQAKVPPPRPKPVPPVTGREKVIVSYKEDPGEVGTWRLTSRQMTFQNEENDYTLEFISRRCHGGRPRRLETHNRNNGDFYAGFTGVGDWLHVRVNGIEMSSLPLGENAVSYWEKGEARGFEIPLVFDDAPVTLRFWMRTGSPCFFGEADFSAAKGKVRSVEVSFRCIPSKLDVVKGKGSRWNGYRREIATARRVVALPDGVKANQTVRTPLGRDEDWVAFRDADYDGSASDGSKGIGPSFLRVGMESVETAATRLSDGWIVGMDYALRPGAKKFRFLVWGNHNRPI